MTELSKGYKASELALLLGGQLLGDDAVVKHLSQLSQGTTASIVVLPKAQEVSGLTYQCAAVVVDRAIDSQHTLIVVQDTRLALARLSQIFSKPVTLAQGIHPSAVIHETVQLAKDVHIGANCVIRANTVIGSATQIGANCTIAENVSIGQDCLLYPQVSIYAGSVIANRVRLHAGVVLGSDGFGYAKSQKGAEKIYHLGIVRLEDDVEIGANTCVDRATLGETVIGARSKIDNLCQIGHNVQLGPDCLIAGTVAIAGSSRLGRGVILGGGVGVVDHICIADGVQVGARSLVTKNIPAGEIWNGYPAEPYKKFVRKHYLMGKLEQIWQAVKGN